MAVVVTAVNASASASTRSSGTRSVLVVRLVGLGPGFPATRRVVRSSVVCEREPQGSAVGSALDLSKVVETCARKGTQLNQQEKETKAKKKRSKG